jgi:SAM-dependent methyltransferase
VNAAAGGWETWSWDESLFAGAAGYYEQGRLPYAPGLADAFARSLALDGQGRLLDVGCGPGTVTLRLAQLFEAVVGLDPDSEMLARASQAAAEQGVGNAAWTRQRAEALPAGLGSFRVVTFAASFHWMDRPRVASAAATMLDSGGAVVQVDAPGYRAGELSAETRRALFRSRLRPTAPSTSCAAGTWAAAGGPGRASATPRPAVRTGCSRRPASCLPRR